MPTVTIIGAGTMGAGIAQVAATHGWTVDLVDVDAAVVAQALDGVRARLDRMLEKGRMDAAARDAAAARLRVGDFPACCAGADLVIEAVVERMDVKVDVLGRALASLPAHAIVATNTSSLSVTELGRGLGAPERTLGMHFFNPAPLLRLVEIIGGDGTDPALVDRAAEIALSWGKVVARAADVPGFIVNHVARPYYLEAFRILEDGVASPAEIDAAMRDLGGFRMGPFELTDLIGQDVNTATTRSVWEQLDEPPLLAPSPLQERLVAEGALGRKSGRGVYRYDVDPPEAAIVTTSHPLDLSAGQQQTIDRFVSGATDRAGTPIARYVVARVLVALIAQAAHAAARGVGTPDDIDTALCAGVNYPRGPFAWAEAIGHDACVDLLSMLAAHTGSERFAVPRGLQPDSRPA